MHSFFFFLSFQFIAFASLAVFHPITNLQGNEIYINNNSAKFLAHFTQNSFGRIFEISLRDNRGEFVSSEIGTIELYLPSEKVYFVPTHRLTHKIDHAHTFLIGISVKKPVRNLFVYLTTEECYNSVYTSDSLKFPLVFSNTEENHAHAIDTQSSNYNRHDKKPIVLPVSPKQYLIDSPEQHDNKLSILVYSRFKHSSSWELDPQQWTEKSTNIIGKMRKIIIQSDSKHSAVNVSISNGHSLLKLSYEENDLLHHDSLTLPPEKNVFYVRVKGFISNDVYSLVIKRGKQQLNYSIRLGSKHYESKQRKKRES